MTKIEYSFRSAPGADVPNVAAMDLHPSGPSSTAAATSPPWRPRTCSSATCANSSARSGDPLPACPDDQAVGTTGSERSPSCPPCRLTASILPWTELRTRAWLPSPNTSWSWSTLSARLSGRHALGNTLAELMEMP
jgi:hypothetical protein